MAKTKSHDFRINIRDSFGLRILMLGLERTITLTKIIVGCLTGVGIVLTCLMRNEFGMNCIRCISPKTLRLRFISYSG